MEENKNTQQGQIGGFDSVESADILQNPQLDVQEPQNTLENAPADGFEVAEDVTAPEEEKVSAEQEAPSEQSFTPTTPQYGFLPNGNYGAPSYSPAEYTQPPKVEKPVKPKKPKTKNYTLTAVVVSAVLACVIGLVGGLGGAVFLFQNMEQDTSSDPLDSVVQPNNQGTQNIVIETQVDSLVEAVYQKSGNSVVGISTTSASGSLFGGSTEQTTGEGSGIIYSADGYIITNYHVISNAVESRYQSKIYVYLPADTEKSYTATVVGYNISSDLAVIKIDKTGLPAIEIGDSESLKIGQYVVAIGSPGGLTFMGSTSFGIISGLNREITIESVGTMSLIQTDAAINPGNSGGALLNAKGQLVGVNSVKFVDESYEGMGFSIPVKTVVEICNNIIKNEDEPSPYVGIEISSRYSATTLQMLGFPAGAVVQSVYEGSPAAQSGIQRGDIITEFNGTAVTSYTQINGLVNSCHPGDSITIKLYRSGKYYTTSLTVGANNEQK